MCDVQEGKLRGISSQEDSSAFCPVFAVMRQSGVNLNSAVLNSAQGLLE